MPKSQRKIKGKVKGLYSVKNWVDGNAPLATKKGKRITLKSVPKEDSQVVVINPQSLAALAKSATVNPKWVGPYSDRHHILVVGDGNLSFSLDLATELGGKKIVGTSYDSRTDFHDKYKASINNPQTLSELGARVFFEVDATQLTSSPWNDTPARFDRIIFNFPHTGVSGSGPDAVESNQKLLREFFSSCMDFLIPLTGEVHLTLRPTEFYNRWKVVEQAVTSGLLLSKTIDFNSHLYPCYENCRTASSDLVRSAPSTEGAKTYCFKLPAGYRPAKKTPSTPSSSSSSISSTPPTVSTSTPSTSYPSPSLPKPAAKKIVEESEGNNVKQNAGSVKRTREEVSGEKKEVQQQQQGPKKKRKQNKKKKSNKAAPWGH